MFFARTLQLLEWFVHSTLPAALCAVARPLKGHRKRHVNVNIGGYKTWQRPPLIGEAYTQLTTQLVHGHARFLEFPLFHRRVTNVDPRPLCCAAHIPLIIM